MSIISLSGKINSGKDTVAKIIQDLDPEKNWKVKKFAGKLKEIASILANVPTENWEDPDFKNSNMPLEWGMTYREFLQRLGTDCIRDCLNPDTWVNALFSEYSETENWIITDTRFLNEMFAIEQRSGIKVKIYRPDLPTTLHSSESELRVYDAWDHVIFNSDDLSFLQEEVKKFYKKFF